MMQSMLDIVAATILVANLKIDESTGILEEPINQQ